MSECPHCGKVMRYKSDGISAVEILRAKKGAIGFNTGLEGTRVSDLFVNRRIILEYINEERKKGHEFVGSVSYEGLPYSGMLVFNIPVTEEEMEAEESEEELSEEEVKRISDVIRENRLKRISLKEQTKPIPRATTPKKIEDPAERERVQKLFEEEYNKYNKDQKLEESLEKKIEDEMIIQSRKNDNDELNRKIKDSLRTLKEAKDLSKEVKQPKQELDSDDLMNLYEEENPGKNAVWNEKETKAYREWKSNYKMRQSIERDL